MTQYDSTMTLGWLQNDNANNFNNANKANNTNNANNFNNANNANNADEWLMMLMNDADEWCLSKAGASWPVGLVYFLMNPKKTN